MKRLFYLLISSLILLTSCSKSSEEKTSFDFGSVDFEEPFRGWLHSRPNILVASLNYPPYKWLVPDTCIIEKTFVVDFNEEALRSHSSAKIAFVDSLYSPIEGLQFYANGKAFTDNFYCISADSAHKEITIKCKIDPILCERVCSGYFVVKGTELDITNETSLNQEVNTITSWSLKQEYNIPWLLWFLWLLSLIIAIAIAIYIIYLFVVLCKFIIPYLKKLKLRLKENPPTKKYNKDTTDDNNDNEDKQNDDETTRLSAGTIQRLIALLYSYPKPLYYLIRSLLPSSFKTTIDKFMPKYEFIKRGIVIPRNDKEERTLREIKQTYGKKLVYKHGEPDFTPIAEYKVRLKGTLDSNIPPTPKPRTKVSIAQDNAGKQMISSRKGKKIIAKYLNKSIRSITMDDYYQWKDDALNIGTTNHNPKTPHETIDGLYIMWVPKKYHDVSWNGIAHTGGVSMLESIRTGFNKNLN